VSIADYSELLIEVAQRSGQADLPQRGKMLVGMLEVYLNKKLRTADQEASATVTADANGDASLPTDRIEIKGVYYDDVRVPRRTFSDVEVDFSGWGWYSEGDTLKSTLDGRELEIRYYQAIPSLHTNGTNWLLTNEPEIYLTGLLWQARMKEGDIEQAAVARGYLDGLIAELEIQDRRKRRGHTEIDMGGKNYERGNDFTITA
jgi:hypothetical protein